MLVLHNIGMLHADFGFYLRSDQAQQNNPKSNGVVSAILVKRYFKKGLWHTFNFADFRNVACSGGITSAI